MIKKYGYFFMAAFFATYPQGSLQATAKRPEKAPLDLYRNTQLHLACARQSEGEVEMLLFLNKDDIYAKNISQSQPIHLACFSGNANIVKLLIESDTQLNEVDGSGRTPLMIARERYESYMLYQTVLCKTENGRDEIRVPSKYNQEMAKKFKTIIDLLTTALDQELAQLAQELNLD